MSGRIVLCEGKGGNPLSDRLTALDIANFYIQLVNSLPDNSIDNLKLNKIIYYAQGWSLVRLGHPLFTNEIQAWDYGPVVPEVYREFRHCGSEPIDKPSAVFDEDRLSSQELSLLVDVYDNYGKYTGWALKEMTHRKGSPWDRVYQKGMNSVITCESMMEAFSKDSIDIFDAQKLNIPVVSAIPTAWDSEGDTAYG